MDRADIANWIQRQDEELLGYHPSDEDAQGEGFQPVLLPEQQTVTHQRRCQVLVNGLEVEAGLIDTRNGTVRLLVLRAEPCTMVVVQIDEETGQPVEPHALARGIAGSDLHAGQLVVFDDQTQTYHGIEDSP